MDNALQTTLEIAFERKHVTVGGKRYEFILQICENIVFFCKIFYFPHAIPVDAAQFATQAEKFRRALVGDTGVVGYAAAQCGRELQGERT